MAAADQLARRPQLSTSRNHDGDVDLDNVRRQNDMRLKKRFESIFDKYERDFSDVGDVVDLRTGRLEIDNGHFRNMRGEDDPGSRIRASRRVTVEDEVERHGGRRYESATKSFSQYPPMHQTVQQPQPSFAHPTLPQNANPQFQSQQPYATYQQSVVSLPVMNGMPNGMPSGMQQFNPFDPNALVSLIDQRVQNQLAQYMPPPSRRTPAIEDRWRTPQRHLIRSPVPANPYYKQGRISRSPSASSSGSELSRRGSRALSDHGSQESEPLQGNEWDDANERGVWAGSVDGVEDGGLDAPGMGDDGDEQPLEPTESLWGISSEQRVPKSRETKGILIPWTKQEISTLIHLRSQGMKFRNIAEHLPGRSQRACCNLWVRLPGSKRDAAIVQEHIVPSQSSENAATEEDSRIQRHPHAADHRRALLAHIEKKKRRDYNRSSGKARYTREQDDLIMYLREVKKQPFRLIEAAIPGRTARSLANRYYDILQHQNRLPLSQPPATPVPSEARAKSNTNQPAQDHERDSPQTTHFTQSRPTPNQDTHYHPPMREEDQQSVPITDEVRSEDEAPLDPALSDSRPLETDDIASMSSHRMLIDSTKAGASTGAPEQSAPVNGIRGSTEKSVPTGLPNIFVEPHGSSESRLNVDKAHAPNTDRDTAQDTVRSYASMPETATQNIPKKRPIQAVVPNSSNSEAEVSSPRAPATDIVRKVSRISDPHVRAAKPSNPVGKKVRVSLPARLHPADDDLGSEDELGM